jgi:replicative DNA helicase
VTKKKAARCHRAADVFVAWREEILTGKPPVLYPMGSGRLAEIAIGPGRVGMLGGLPGGGKTALVNQLTVDALRLSSTLRACICNVEMDVRVLLDRQLARLSGVGLSQILKRSIDAEHASRIDSAFRTLEPLMDRLTFVRPPFDLENVAAAVDEDDSDLLVLDYIQRIRPPGKHGDRRSAVDATMDYLRQFADAGRAVIVVAAVARTKDNKGRSSYAAEGLSLASFRESSELEFGADDAYMLVPDAGCNTVTLRHLKARHSEPRDMSLVFHRACQRFSPVENESQGNGGVTRSLAKLWTNTPPAKEGEDAPRH